MTMMELAIQLSMIRCKRDKGWKKTYRTAGNNMFKKVLRRWIVFGKMTDLFTKSLTQSSWSSHYLSSGELHQFDDELLFKISPVYDTTPAILVILQRNGWQMQASCNLRASKGVLRSPMPIYRLWELQRSRVAIESILSGTNRKLCSRIILPWCCAAVALLNGFGTPTNGKTFGTLHWSSSARRLW